MLKEPSGVTVSQGTMSEEMLSKRKEQHSRRWQRANGSLIFVGCHAISEQLLRFIFCVPLDLPSAFVSVFHSLTTSASLQCCFLVHWFHSPSKFSHHTESCLTFDCHSCDMLWHFHVWNVQTDVQSCGSILHPQSNFQVDWKVRPGQVRGCECLVLSKGDYRQLALCQRFLERGPNSLRAEVLLQFWVTFCARSLVAARKHAGPHVRTICEEGSQIEDGAGIEVLQACH